MGGGMGSMGGGMGGMPLMNLYPGSMGGDIIPLMNLLIEEGPAGPHVTQVQNVRQVQAPGPKVDQIQNVRQVGANGQVHIIHK